MAYSAEAHYTHARMCEVLGVRGIAIATDQAGRLDLEDLRAKAMETGIGTVVATAGTTGIGTVDPIDDLVVLGQELGFRIHVDAAYGGYYTLLAGLPAEHPAALDPEVAAAFRAIEACDSIVIDPHKHGLQALRMRIGDFPGRRRRAVLQARFAVHLFHLGRTASGRDQPRMLACRSDGSGALGNDASLSARSERGDGGDPAEVPARCQNVGGGDRALRGIDAADVATARHHRGVPPCDRRATRFGDFVADRPGVHGRHDRWSRRLSSWPSSRCSKSEWARFPN
ncbi:MAG: pyridoxal-dependent decarboxylase [Thermomicrobiales bacterium]